MFIAGGAKDRSSVVSVLIVDALDIYFVNIKNIFVLFQIAILFQITIIRIRGHLERMSQDGCLALVSWILGSSLSSHLDINMMMMAMIMVLMMLMIVMLTMLLILIKIMTIMIMTLMKSMLHYQ